MQNSGNSFKLPGMPPEPYFEIDPDPETAKRIRKEREGPRAQTDALVETATPEKALSLLRQLVSAGPIVNGPRGAAGPRREID